MVSSNVHKRLLWLFIELVNSKNDSFVYKQPSFPFELYCEFIETLYTHLWSETVCNLFWQQTSWCFNNCMIISEHVSSILYTLRYPNFTILISSLYLPFCKSPLFWCGQSHESRLQRVSDAKCTGVEQFSNVCCFRYSASHSLHTQHW